MSDPLDNLPSGTRGRRHRALGVAAAALVVAAAAAGGFALLHPTAASPAATGGAVPLGTAQVRRMDLNATQQLPGTLGFATPGTVVNQLPAAGASPTPAQAQAAVDAAQQQLGAARTALTDLRRVDALTVAQAHDALARAQVQRATDAQTLGVDQTRLASDAAAQQRDCSPTPSTSGCSTDQQAVQHDQQSVTADQATVAHDDQAVVAAQASSDLAGPHAQQSEDGQAAQVASAQSALATAQAQQALSRDATPAVVTAIPAVGQVIDRGQSLFSVGGRPIPLLVGAVPDYRTLAAGVGDGADIAQLQDNLDHLDAANGLAADGHWTPALTAAVLRWQASLGVAQTGEIDLGQAEFLPGPVRVTALHVSAGEVLQPGAQIFDDTSTSRSVSAALSAGQTGIVHQGDAVSIALPDGKTVVTGHVATVAAAQAQAVQGQSAGQQIQQQNGGPQAQVAVTITVDDPARVGAVDVAPVTITVTTQSVRGVLAVPVDALLALEGGGYAVEVVAAGGAHQLVGVTPGLFDGAAMVQVSGAGLVEGTTVVVPAA